MVSNLPSRTAVQIIELKEPGSETREGYAQGGPVQNFRSGGIAGPQQFLDVRRLQQAQLAEMRTSQGPFGQSLFQRFQNTGFVPPPQQQQRPQQQNMPYLNMQMLQAQQSGPPPNPNPMQYQPTHDGPGSMGSPIMDRMARGNFISTRGPDSLGAQQHLNAQRDAQMRMQDRMAGGGSTGIAAPGSFGQMGPPQQIGQVAEPNTQQLASQLQNVTQQVNQLSSHLGVSGGGISQGPSQLNQLQGGIGGLLQTLRPGPPPQRLAQAGPVRPPMFQTFR